MQSKFVSSKNDGKNNRSTASQAASTLFIGNRLKADATEFQFAFSRSIGQMGKDDLYSLLTLSISNKDLFTIREVLDISRKKNFDLQNTVYLHGKPSSVFGSQYHMMSLREIVSKLGRDDLSGECARIEKLLVQNGAL